MSNEFLNELESLESDFDKSFMALIKHTGANGLRNIFTLDDKSYSLVIEGEDIPSITVNENTGTGIFEVVINGVNFGAFDQVDKGGQFSFFPKRNDLLTGDHLIAIGKELIKINKLAQEQS